MRIHIPNADPDPDPADQNKCRSGSGSAMLPLNQVYAIPRAPAGGQETRFHPAASASLALSHTRTLVAPTGSQLHF
jgi:hypothetical protein